MNDFFEFFYWFLILVIASVGVAGGIGCILDRVTQHPCPPGYTLTVGDDHKEVSLIHGEMKKVLFITCLQN